MAERFQKVATSQEHQTINNVDLYETQKRQPSLLLRIGMVSAKTFIAGLSVYELANYSSAKRLIYFSLDFCILGLRNYKQYMYFVRLVLATVKQKFRLVLKRWRKPPEKIRARIEVPREILAFWQTKR